MAPKLPFFFNIQNKKTKTQKRKQTEPPNATNERKASDMIKEKIEKNFCFMISCMHDMMITRDMCVCICMISS